MFGESLGVNDEGSGELADVRVGMRILASEGGF